MCIRDSYKIASNSTPYFLSRPRRFGKSLLISTFEAYFQGRKDLFHGLAIAKQETRWEEYPVLHLDLNARKYETAGYLSLIHIFTGLCRFDDGLYGLFRILVAHHDGDKDALDGTGVVHDTTVDTDVYKRQRPAGGR